MLRIAGRSLTGTATTAPRLVLVGSQSTASAAKVSQRLIGTYSSSAIATRVIPGLSLLQSSTRFQVTAVPAVCGLNSLAVQYLSSNAGGEGDKKADAKSAKSADGGEGDDAKHEIVLTPGQKVVAGTRLTMWAGIFCFATACAYYIGKELLPTKMSPNAVFDRATELVRANGEVSRRFGEPLKAYGRDHGGHREGRRNFIEHTEYTDKEDGSKRTRVRFNLEGKFGKAFVFAEVSSDMPSGEFVYVLVQDKANGRVFTVVDNRSRLAAARMAGGNKEGMEALQNLLGGSKS